MKHGGATPDRCAGALLSAAFLVDATVLLTLTLLIGTPLLPFLDFIPEGGRYIIVFATLLLLHWVFFDLIFGGWTLGRSVLGLHLCDENGRALSRGKKVKRGLRKLTALGLSGANPLTVSAYDRAVGAVWYSPIAPAKARPLGEWRLLFKSGSLKGKKTSLARLTSFKSHKRIRFGRDKKWCDVALGMDDVQVSGQHCILFARGNELYLRDGNEAGKGSSNGTYLNRKRLKTGEVRAVGTARQFSIANILVEIQR